MTTAPILSVSQVEDFDPDQLGGCPRRWWFERIQGHRPESTAASEDGHQGHALSARYLTTGERPGRVRLGKAVNAVIDAGHLPRPGPHLQVERRFSGQPHRDTAGAWVPLDVSRTLWHAGHPWEGFIDLRFRHRSGTATVWDHKFSSDIHDRALPAERLIRTVQMPVYALDTLREWPDTRGFNLVHLYVSRRGVESFIRHQRVSVEQVQKRAAELVPLVQQMDAVRGVTAQDDVPFNRAACHARMGCPHQFRCNAFRRKPTMMELSDEEMAQFGIASGKGPALVGPVTAENWDRRPFDSWPLNGLMCGVCGKPQRTTPGGPCCESGHGGADGVKPAAGQDVGDSLNLDDIFTDMPKPSAPKPQPAPMCDACGEVLTPENSSRLKTGDVKHIGCAVATQVKIGSASATNVTVVSELPGASTAGGPVSITPKCADCPHPAHDGKPCEGKRGRGRCLCGAAAGAPRVLADGTRVESTGKPKHSAAELQAMAEEAARAADVDGDGAAVEEARQLSAAEIEAGRRLAGVEGRSTAEDLAFAERRISNLEGALAASRASSADVAPRGSWSGTLAVNVTVELGPSTLAILDRLVKR